MHSSEHILEGEVGPRSSGKFKQWENGGKYVSISYADYLVCSVRNLSFVYCNDNTVINN